MGVIGKFVTKEIMSQHNVGEDEITGVSGPSLSATTLSPNLNLNDLEGRVIAGRYRIIRRIGKGGMGVVYLAQQTNLNRDVVIKILAPQLVDDDSSVIRFEREARGLSRLQHPNIVTIYDFGQDDDLAYIAMEFADGETLSKYIKRCSPLSIEEFLPIAVQILRGIGEAHKLGLIHRDIKPANIILCELEGEKNFVKILDFGLAKLAEGQEDVTKEQQLVGSASFLAPEQILEGQSDPRSDVYALGILFYQMIVGKKPFTGANDNVILYKHVNELPPRLATMVSPEQKIPESLCDLIDSCLVKNPALRPPTANDLLFKLSHSLDLPELLATWSSVSLAKVDLQKLIDEGSETIIRPSGQHNAVMADAINLSPVAVAPLRERESPQHRETVLSSISSISRVRPRERSILFILILALCVAILAVGAILLRYRLSKNSEPKVHMPQHIVAMEQNLERILQNAQAEIDAQRWLNAEELLTTYETEFKSNPDMLIRATDMRSRLSIAKQMAQAKLIEAENPEEAIALYAEVLKIDANNEDALKSIEALREVIAEKQLGNLVFLNVHELDGAQLYIDNVLVEGGVPPEIPSLEPKSYLLTIKKSGYNDWSQRVELKAGESAEFNVDLSKRSSRSTRPKRDSGSLLLNSGRGVKNSDLLLK
jgi:serine/threonine protein kinase